MAQHYRVKPMYWKGDRRRWDDQEKLLGLYLLTCAHRNLEGLYWLPKAYIAADLGWPPKTVARALTTLIDAGFCQYDDAAEVMLMPKALAHQAPSTEKQLTGAITSLEAVPETALWDEFLVACESHSPKLANRIRMETRSHSNGTANAIRF